MSQHLTMVPKWYPFYHERPAVGIENDTHVVWGRWDDQCIIGADGSYSGCSGSHGGDGFVLTYDVAGYGPQEPWTNWHDQYPFWTKFRYELRPIDELFNLAQDPAQCGDNNELFACPEITDPPFHSPFNGKSCDKGDLPWVWAEQSSWLPHTCQTTPLGFRYPNLLSDPARIFDNWFLWPDPVNFFEVPPGPQYYVSNPYQVIETACPAPSF